MQAITDFQERLHIVAYEVKHADYDVSLLWYRFDFLVTCLILRECLKVAALV